MLKAPYLDINNINNCLKEKDYNTLCCQLRGAFKLERNETGIPIPFKLSEEAIAVLHNILKEFVDKKVDKHETDLLKELFRSLRNYVISPDVQNFLIRTDMLLDIMKLVDAENGAIYDVLPLIMQFLINLIVSNNLTTAVVYNIFSNQIFHCLKEKIVIYEASALLYNISLHKDLILNFDVYNCILDLHNSDNYNEFINFLVEKFLTSDSFWNSYKSFDIHKRMLMLSIIRDKQIEGEALKISEHALKTLTIDFVNSGHIIFQTVSNKIPNLEPYEVSLLLEVIASLCGIEDYLVVLQQNKDLMIHCGVFLINVHRLGKDAENHFSTIQTLSEIRQPPSSVYEHPAFGFKASLIRIIGNLCWKNKTMQNLLREAELIPVLLDCCNMDARNPFIMQWVILAVHNLCENNLENQKIIAEMHQEGTVTSSVLEEMGMTLHCEGDNSIKIIPMEVLKNKK